MRFRFNRASADVDWHVGHGALQGFVAATRKQFFSNYVVKGAVRSTSPDMRTHLPCFAADAMPNGASLEDRPPRPIENDALHARSTRNVRPWQSFYVAKHMVSHADRVHARG